MRLADPIVCLAMVVVLGACSAQKDGSPAPSPTAEPAGLVLGQCVRLAGDTPQSPSLDTVDCTSPHHGEVVLADEQFFEVDELPTQDQVAAAGDAACAQALQIYAGPAGQESGLQMSYTYPTQETWEQGDRHLTCIAIAYDMVTQTPSDIVGSIRAATPAPTPSG
jgi:hypothetical protein